MAISQAEAQRQLDLWLEASAALSQGRYFSIGDRVLTLSNAAEARRMVAFYSRLADGGRLFAGSGGYGRRRLPVPPGVEDETPS